MKLNLFLALSLSVFIVSCEKNQIPESGLIGQALMADRPVMTPDRQIYLIELKQPALLSTSIKNSEGVNQIDPVLASEVQTEQKNLEEKLQSLSADIQVLYRYKYIINAVTVIAPTKLEKEIKSLSAVRAIEPRKPFAKPVVKMTDLKVVNKAIDLAKTSVTHIEAGAAYEQGIRGQNIRVGVLDTGTDFTHTMFGGSGLKADYESVDPDQPSPFFPNKKLPAGIDLAGSRFDSSSLDPARVLPKPDANPLDEEGHGTHVAGTIAGIGDGVNTYDGVAPDAEIYTIKVFGSGSTSDEIVIAGLEWAVDPNQDGNLNDQMHVVNLSLGGGNGTPYELYNKAVTQLSNSGTVVVASAGNSSDISFIVGSPSTSDEALSVAASIDSSEHNWRFRTIGFYLGEEKLALTEAIEAATSKPIVEAGDVRGSLVYMGLAAVDFTEEEKAILKGNVALIDRGAVSFDEKIVRAQAAGAIGAIIVQSVDEAPFTMGTATAFEIPAVMISKSLGGTLKEKLLLSPVEVRFQNAELIEKPELINQITDFSSRGPRSVDLLIKPEITGPGSQIISAKMGGGAEGIKLSGTSMSGPHLAGVMALMKQKHSTLTSRELKSILMSTSVPVKNAQGQVDSVARQGAGHVYVSRALKAQFMTYPSSLSLGLQAIDNQKRVVRSLKLKSLFDDSLKIQVSLESSSAAVTLESSTVQLGSKGQTDLKLNFVLHADRVAGLEDEVTGWVVLKTSETQSQRVPFLVRLQKVSAVKLSKVDWGATSQLELEGSTSTFEFKNSSRHAGEVWMFNLIAQDGRKPAGGNSIVSRECDLQVAGYRLNGSKLEIAVKLYSRISAWSLCEISVLFDQNKDQKPEAELALTLQERIPGLSGINIVSTLLDFPKARALREEAEKKSLVTEERVVLDLKDAILSLEEGRADAMKSAVIMQVDVSTLIKRVGLEPQIQVVTSSQEYLNSESDDFLGQEDSWHLFSLDSQSQSWTGLKNLTLQANESKSVELEKAASPKPLLFLYPSNQLDSRGLNDQQYSTLSPQLMP